MRSWWTALGVLVCGACSSFGSDESPPAPPSPVQETEDLDAGTTTDAATIPSVPAPPPACKGTQIDDDFERITPQDAAWTSAYTKDTGTALTIAVARGVDGGSALSAATASPTGSAQTFLRLVVDGSGPTWDFCLSFAMLVEPGTANRLVGPRILAAPKSALGTGEFQAVQFEVAEGVLSLVQTNAGNCPRPGACSARTDALATALAPATLHDVALAIHATAEESGAFGTIEVSVDGVGQKVPLTAALGPQPYRELRLGVQTAKTGALLYDRVRIDAAP